MAVIAAILAVIAGVLAFETVQSAQEKKMAQQALQEGKDELSSLKSQVAALQDETQRLRDENSRLSGTAPVNPLRPPDPATGGPVERHSGVITLRGEEVDLDAPGDDPRWRSVQGGDADLRTETNGYLGVLGGSMYLPLSSTEPSYEVCSTATGYQTGGGFISGFREGENYCFITSEDRYVAARLLEVTDDYYKFDVTTFDPPAR